MIFKQQSASTKKHHRPSSRQSSPTSDHADPPVVLLDTLQFSEKTGEAFSTQGSGRRFVRMLPAGSREEQGRQSAIF